MLEPLIIGHRGASAVAPENTLFAFERAMSDGADGIEFDVQLAADGRPVVIHDATLKRTALKKGAVSDLTSKELNRVDVGSWFNLRYPARARDEYAGAHVPMLIEVLELFSDAAPLLYIEMKCTASQDRLLAQEVVRLIRQAKLIERAIVVSFSLDAIREIKRLDNAMCTGALFEPKLIRPLPSKRAIVDRAIRYQADEILWHRSLITARGVEEAKQRGLTSTVWTVDHNSWITRARKLGIHAIITNDPRRLARQKDKLIADSDTVSPKTFLS